MRVVLCLTFCITSICFALAGFLLLEGCKVNKVWTVIMWIIPRFITNTNKFTLGDLEYATFFFMPHIDRSRAYSFWHVPYGLSVHLSAKTLTLAIAYQS